VCDCPGGRDAAESGGSALECCVILGQSSTYVKLRQEVSTDTLVYAQGKLAEGKQGRAQHQREDEEHASLQAALPQGKSECSSQPCRCAEGRACYPPPARLPGPDYGRRVGQPQRQDAAGKLMAIKVRPKASFGSDNPTLRAKNTPRTASVTAKTAAGENRR